MGRISYMHEGKQTDKAVLYDNQGNKVGTANRSFNGAYWVLNPENIHFKEAILRALDAMCIYY